MPQLGPLEIVVVLLVALMVFGPKRLPEVGRQVGQGLRELRKIQETVRAEINDVLHAPDVVDLVWGTAAAMGYGHIFVDASYNGPIVDDHTPLIEAGFRAIDVIDIDYKAWHTPLDTPDKVTAASLEAVGNVAVGVIRRATK